MAAQMSTSGSTIPIKVHFTGGLEIIFSNIRNLTIELLIPDATPSSSSSISSSSSPASPRSSSSSSTTTTSPPTISTLISHLTTHPSLDQSRKDLFVLPGDEQTVRPGILVLINDADWALEGEGECELEEGDEVVFVSTLHGG